VSERAPGWMMQAAVAVAVGLALGFTVGWWLWPVQYTNTAPAVLRQDYRDDYIVMVATAYEVERDLEQARERLKLLNPEEPAVSVTELAERLIEADGSSEDIARLARLARALGATAPTLIPYLEGPP
jgi:hypothetical protein